jgi:transglutaminase-like putative cysteine protease
MKLITHFLIILLCVSLVSAVNYDDKNTVESLVTIGNTFNVVPSSSSYTIKYINASMSSFPRGDSRQVVTELVTEPSAKVGDSVDFIFNNPIKSSYTISVQARVVTRNTITEVGLPILFPLKNLDSSLYDYTQPTSIVDVTPEIKNLASELISDKTDLYEIEYIFAEYVRKNIAYDMSTLTSSANQRSSWVLENKRGVCDEITNLFISLNRAAGIPTRFVSGVAYTNLEDVFGTSWVPHAWAEVYYPGIGWIPYDVTYGQYGFLDAGHIKFQDSKESSSSNVDYTYLGSDVKIVPEEITDDVKVLNYGENVHGTYTFVASAYDDEIGFGSYDLISVDVTNPHNYYIVADLYLADTQDVDIIEVSKETVLNRTIHRKQVLLKPHESSKIYWIVHIDKSLDKNYVYNFPITVYNTYNDTSTTFITSRRDYKNFEYTYFTNLISSSTEESSKPYSKYIYLECNPDSDSIYLEDSVNLSCLLDNKGDKTFDDINICMDDECTHRSLAIQKIPLSYSKNFKSEGLKNIAIKAYDDEFLKVSYVTINVMDKPAVSISELVYPESVSYAEQFDVSFNIVKDSKSNPKDLKVVIKSETAKVEWSFPEFNEDKSFTLKSRGDALKPDENNYKLTVYYYDEKGKEYTVEKEFMIVSKARWYEKILLYINMIGRSIEQAVSG